jgi:MSHA biogenesis protein MshP
MTSRRQTGFLLMLAIFLIVTLSAIGIYLVTISTGQVEAASQDEQGARAYQAARAGIDWGAFQVLRNSVVPPASASDFGPTCKTTNAASQTLTLGTLGAPAGATPFRATVSCSRSAETEGGNTVEIYTLTVTGCNRSSCPGTPDSTYVERQLQLVLSN